MPSIKIDITSLNFDYCVDYSITGPPVFWARVMRNVPEGVYMTGKKVRIHVPPNGTVSGSFLKTYDRIKGVNNKVFTILAVMPTEIIMMPTFDVDRSERWGYMVRGAYLELLN